MNRPIIGVMAYNYNLVCELCKTPYKGLLPSQKTCSVECRRIRLGNITGRAVINEIGLPTGTVGSISELAVSCELMTKGYSVFRALSPSCFCDLIICKGDVSYKVEVRTGYIGTNGILHYPKNKNGVVDLFGIFERNIKKIYFRDLDNNPVEL